MSMPPPPSQCRAVTSTAACSAAACCALQPTRCALSAPWGETAQLMTGFTLPHACQCLQTLACMSCCAAPSSCCHAHKAKWRAWWCVTLFSQMAKAAEVRQREKEAALARLEKVIGVHGKQVWTEPVALWCPVLLKRLPSSRGGSEWHARKQSVCVCASAQPAGKARASAALLCPPQIGASCCKYAAHQTTAAFSHASAPLLLSGLPRSFVQTPQRPACSPVAQKLGIDPSLMPLFPKDACNFNPAIVSGLCAAWGVLRGVGACHPSSEARPPGGDLHPLSPRPAAVARPAWAWPAHANPTFAHSRTPYPPNLSCCPPSTSCVSLPLP